MTQRKSTSNFPKRCTRKMEPPDSGVVLCPAQQLVSLGFCKPGASRRSFLQEVRIGHDWVELAQGGHDVHVIDLVPHHVQMVRDKASARALQLGSASIGDAVSLSFSGEFADLVLLMGPLYHMTDPEQRLRALRECARILKPGGRVACTVISRFASMLAGFRNDRFDDLEFEAVVDGALRDGQHRNPVTRTSHLRTAFFHRPSELRDEIERSGLVCERIVGIESPIAIIKRLDDWVDKKGRTYELAVKYAQMVEEEEELLGASFHLLGVGRRP